MPAYYCSSISQFLQERDDALLGQLISGNTSFGFPNTESSQIDAWREELRVLKNALVAINDITCVNDWGILMEYPIPRRQQRIDVVILARDIIFVIEFKTGQANQRSHARHQVEDYALDLADFHAPSRGRAIFPLVLESHETQRDNSPPVHNVRPVLFTSPAQLSTMLSSLFLEHSSDRSLIEPTEWNNGSYQPVPTIIEAARVLYSGSSVREITHSHAGISNLTKTTEYVLSVVADAQRSKQKVICFVTGIPGAGKTLAGLNVVHSREVSAKGGPASVFMSGNGPLVDILREALALDSAARNREPKNVARRKVRTFVQNIHHFVHDNLDRHDSQPPYEHAIVFDEAQRAWNADQNRRKYRERASAWHISEPEMVLRIMDRHADWAVIVALVGGGQEIHHGEAGLSEWGKALLRNYRHWRVAVSPEAINGGESVAGTTLFSEDYGNLNVVQDGSLHLNTCVRSYRAKQLSSWVNRILAGDSVAAAEVTRSFEAFPILLTRDLAQARNWLQENTRGTRRCGLVASSGAARLRAYGIETSKAFRDSYSYPAWFLAPRGDVRSSYQLETAATEFEIQGLELDHIGLCWGGDFTRDASIKAWKAAEFKGTKWAFAAAARRIEQTRNKYRVLLTRAREGMVIWVPAGDKSDPTRSVNAMDETAEYLLRCGAVPLS